jgi:hypothetical protein
MAHHRKEQLMRLIVIGLLAGPLVGWTGTTFAQPATTTALFGKTCTVTFPHSIVRHQFIMRNGTPIVHAWYKTPNGANVFVGLGESPITINPDGSMQFESGHYRLSVVPDAKGKAEVTIAGMGNRSSTSEYDECIPSP